MWFRAKRLDYLLLQSHLTPFDIKKMNLYPVKANPSPLKRQGLAGQTVFKTTYRRVREFSERLFVAGRGLKNILMYSRLT
ncbi:hypothetical protein ED026_11080 [Salmonella enterica]|nr:hypothetical protein [Salmonella enterica]EAP6950188.1 hypothetical protein [Salmonella enterica]EBJ5334759.1 hypothetical protein [Salmonella enterica]MEQ26060.1 hypothetical protein [Salmonella enterica]MFF94533.1 hypothetical protein [Salmonella enterica]